MEPEDSVVRGQRVQASLEGVVLGPELEFPPEPPHTFITAHSELGIVWALASCLKASRQAENPA